MACMDDSVYIAEGAIIKGNVTIGEESSVWFNAVVRAENQPIVIGKRTNIQDNCTLHISPDSEIVIGDDVTIGHGAIVHGCKVGDNTLIGMGSIILDHAEVGSNCVIGAGTLVTQGKVIPDGYMALGSPAKIVRKLSDEEIAGIKESAMHYVQMAKEYK